jgi:DNA mismatch repair protein MutL
MSRIKQLPLEEIQKIAAGEVVERPANIVKELVENALDAGATALTLYIEDGGKKMVRVIDNGHGMSEIDARASILHHATSKISTFNDLEILSTFGFRGEALSSISAVSSMTLTTKEDSSLEGIRLIIEGAVIRRQEIASCTTGTDISVANIFDNIPVRKKFLKTRDTEWRAIQTLVQAFCLAYPERSFKLYHDEKLIVNCPGVTTLQERLGQLFDKALLDALVIEHHKDPKGAFAIHAAFSRPWYLRYDRSSLFLFVNKRWVKNHKLTQAILRGYLKTLPPARYPAGAVFITIDPTLIDINIHPRKEEVLFLHPRTVQVALEALIQKGLERDTLPASSQPTSLFAQTSYAFSPKASSIVSETFLDNPSAASARPSPEKFHEIMQEAFGTSSSPVLGVTQQAPSTAPLESQELQHTIIEQALPVAHHSIGGYTIIGQLYNTYILIETEQGLMLVDQHAAHERILYELFSYRFEDVSIVSLAFPTIITISQADCSTLTPYLELLNEYGLHLEAISCSQLSLTAIPVYYKDQSVKELLAQVVGWIIDMHGLTSELLTTKLQEKLRAQMACKAAVKAGDSLTPEHMQQLLQQLDQTKNKFSCPHGRPTTWLITRHEIERKFKRS